MWIVVIGVCVWTCGCCIGCVWGGHVECGNGCVCMDMWIVVIGVCVWTYGLL